MLASSRQILIGVCGIINSTCKDYKDNRANEKRKLDVAANLITKQSVQEELERQPAKSQTVRVIRPPNGPIYTKKYDARD